MFEDSPSVQVTSTDALRWWTGVMVLLVGALLAGACASDAATGAADTGEVQTDQRVADQAASPSDEPESNAPSPLAATPETTTTPTPTTTGIASVPGLDQELMVAVVDKVLVSEGAALAVMIDRNGVMAEATNGVDDDGTSPTGADAFRVGSITKVFTALATLTLVEEGAVNLDAPAASYLTRVTVPEGVTVRDLLQHTSGNYDIGQINLLFDAPNRAWTPEESLEAWITTSPREPGSGFTYSSSNYFLLGILLEEVTGQPYATVIRERISTPLGLKDTYVAHFEDGPTPFDPYLPRGVDTYDYTSIATASWSAGALVSSAWDLHKLFTALYEQRIVSDTTVEIMTANDRYGLGLELWDSGLVGHRGFSPGYWTEVVHNPETGVTTFFASTDDFASVTSAGRTMLEGLTSDSASPEDD